MLEWQKSKFRKTPHSKANQILRVLWSAVYLLLFRPSPRFLHAWRRLILRCFGASVGIDVRTFPSVRIWAPWNVTLGDHCSLGDRVDCYSVDCITIGKYTTVSQDTVLCTASHDYEQLHLPLITSPISIGEHVWICAEAFVMPGVRIGDGAVIGVRSTVFDDVEAWQMAFGTPCRAVRQRTIRDET